MWRAVSPFQATQQAVCRAAEQSKGRGLPSPGLAFRRQQATLSLFLVLGEGRAEGRWRPSSAAAMGTSSVQAPPPPERVTARVLGASGSLGKCHLLEEAKSEGG